jgi:hypothetical protein
MKVVEWVLAVLFYIAIAMIGVGLFNISIIACGIWLLFVSMSLAALSIEGDNEDEEKKESEL